MNEWMYSKFSFFTYWYICRIFFKSDWPKYQETFAENKRDNHNHDPFTNTKARFIKRFSYSIT